VGRDADGCWTNHCRLVAARDKADKKRWQQEWEAAAAVESQRRQERLAIAEKTTDCKWTVSDPASDPAVRDQCARWLEDLERVQRQARWTASGAVCVDRRTDERHVVVSCTLPNRSGEPDLLVGSEKVLQLAAFAALASGRTHFVSAGSDPIDGHFSDSATPVHCEEKHRFLHALGAGLTSMQPDATSDCTTGIGGGIHCETRVNPRTPPPPSKFTCTGGDVVSTLISVTTRDYFELLTGEEATARDNPNLPPARRPMAADGVAKVLSGLR